MKFLKSFLFVLGFCALHSSYAGPYASCQVDKGTGSCSTLRVKFEPGTTMQLITNISEQSGRAKITVKGDINQNVYFNRILYPGETRTKFAKASNARWVRGYISEVRTGFVSISISQY